MSAEPLTIFEDPAPNSSIRPNSSAGDAAAEARVSVEIRAGDAPGAATAPAPAVAAPADYAVGKVIDGKYRIERKIGEGAMGVVLAATHIGLDELVAIKFMRPEVQSMEGTLHRFAKEAKIAARIRSEHIAKVIDVGQLAPLGPYIVMEYLEGKSLADLLDTRLFDRRGPMTAERVIEYMLQACEALAAAHAIGVVHRDVKPDNLFVTRHSGLEILKLLDFGISKTTLAAGLPNADAETSTLSSVMGTPLYMSPEQLRSLPDVDCRTDVWSMGAVMYELLSGTPPFQATSVPEICAAILEATPAPLPPGCPPTLGAVVMRCLEKDRERRFQSVAELAAALVPLAPGEARAYASRSSGILRASTLNLDVGVDAIAGDGLRGQRAERRTFRFQSSALVAAAAMLALSALGVVLTLSKMRGSEATPPGMLPVAASVQSLAVNASDLAAAKLVAAPLIAAELTAASRERRELPAQIPAPGPKAKAEPTAATPEANPRRAMAQRSKAPRTIARTPVPAPTNVVVGQESARPVVAESAGVGRVRLVEPRSRLRLVERVEGPNPTGAVVDRSVGAQRRGSGK
jgi:eukaryotic-like serine/threonine-protein kinase